MARIVALFAVFALATAMTSLTAIKTNTCSGTGVAITTPAECKSAVAINTATEWLEPTTNMLNKLEQGGWPKGCICRYPDLACYFNTNSDNGIRDDYGVLCTVASAPTAAPTFSVATLTDNSASSPPPFTNKYDNYRKVANAGTHGGVCTCPNGKTYEVGDNKNNCGSIACEGGSAGPCSSGGISHLGYGMKVTCGVDCPAFSSTAATNVMATASSTLNGDIPSKAVDGNTATIMHTHGSTAHPWLQLDLGSSKRISEVKIWNRQSTWDSILQRLGHHQIWVGDSSVAPGGAGDTGKMCFDGTATTTVGPFNEACSATGQYVRIVQLAYNIMHLAEVEVYINDIQNTDAAAQCTYCPLGQFKNAADSGCTQCAAGKYSAATDATSSNTCVDCEQGKYSAAGATACTSAFKLAHDQYVINTKASLTAAEPLYKKAVSLFGSTTGTDSFLTRGAKRRYNNLLAHDSRKNASEQAFACEDSCSPGGNYTGAGDVAGCTANYCDAYKVGASFRNRCAPGAVGHNFALLECQKTCGICVAKTPFAASELSTSTRDVFGNLLTNVTTHQGRCASALPASATFTAQSKRTVNPDMAGSTIVVDCAAGFNIKPEGDHVVTFLRCDWNATTTLYEWVAHGTCNPHYVFKDYRELQTAVNLWGSNRAAALTTYGHISNNWDTSKVTNMNYLFDSSQWPQSKTFNDPIGAWDTSSVTSMQSMFQDATAFNQPLNTWNTSSVTLMLGMFFHATAFNQPLEAWDTSSVVNSGEMFKGATAFNQPLDAWDMFKGAKSSLFGMPNMFYGATSYNQPLGAWSTPKLAWVYGCFAGATAMTYPVPSAALSTANAAVPVGSIIWGS